MVSPSWGAPREVVQKRAAFFQTTEDRRTIDRRDCLFSTAEFDLAHPDLEIRAAMSGEALLTPSNLETLVQKTDSLFAIGTDAFTTATLAAGTPEASLPAGPLAHEGRWITLPAGVFSAVGFTADHHPVFLTNWLADSPRRTLTAQVEAETGEISPLTLNRPATPSTLTAVTYEFTSARTIRSDDPGAFFALLAPASPPDPVAGVDATSEWSVYKTFSGAAHCVIDPGSLLLGATGESALRWQELLRRNARARLRWIVGSAGGSAGAPAEWAGVREVVGLGAPLVWEGRSVDPARFVSEDCRRRADDDAPARPAVAWFPARNRLQIVWSEELQGSREPIRRRSLIGQLAQAGAACAFEIAGDAEGAPLFVGRKWVGAGSGQGLSPLTPTALLFLQRSTRDRNRVPRVNLCLAEPPSIQASNTLDPRDPAKAVVDGRHGFDPAMDQFWAGAAKDAESPPAWIEIDLHRPHPVQRVEILHAGEAGFSSHFNTAAFRVLGRATNSDSWETLGEAEDNWLSKTAFDLNPPRLLRYIRLEILRPNHCPPNPAARIVEILAWGDPTKP